MANPTTNTGPGDTVTVACKLPSGLILRLFDMVEDYEPVMGGGSRKIKVAKQRPEAFEIKGIGFPQRADPDNRPQTMSGFALTPNIPAEFWDAWYEANKDADVVRNRLIFATRKGGGIQDMAKEHKGQRSGLEPMNPEKVIVQGKSVPADPRIPSGIERFKKDE